MPRKSALDPEEVQSELERLENLTPGEVRFSSGSMSRTLGLSSLVGLGLSIAQRQWLWENLGPTLTSVLVLSLLLVAIINLTRRRVPALRFSLGLGEEGGPIGGQNTTQVTYDGPKPAYGCAPLAQNGSDDS